MIHDVLKQSRRAAELVQIWDAYFPSLKGQAPVEFWMPLLEDSTLNVLAQAIKQCSRKRLTATMAVPEMLSYIQSIGKVIQADKAAAFPARPTESTHDAIHENQGAR